MLILFFFFFFQAEDGIRDRDVTGVQTCALPISTPAARSTTPWRNHASADATRKVVPTSRLPRSRIRTGTDGRSRKSSSAPQDAESNPIGGQEGKNNVRRNQSRSATVFRRRGHDHRRRSTRHDGFGASAIQKDNPGGSANDQAGDEHVVRRAEADRCRRPERWLR